jgi:hypothetical protein
MEIDGREAARVFKDYGPTGPFKVDYDPRDVLSFLHEREPTLNPFRPPTGR